MKKYIALLVLLAGPAQAQYAYPNDPVVPGSPPKVYNPAQPSTQQGNSADASLLPLTRYTITTLPLMLAPVGSNTTSGSRPDSSLDWSPAYFGTFISSQGQTLQVFPTRGTANDANGNPTAAEHTGFLIQAQGNGNLAQAPNALFINMDVVGGTSSASGGPTNSAGYLVSLLQRPDAAGHIPATSWGGNLDVRRAPGSGLAQTHGIELDINNPDCNSSAGSQTCGLIDYYFYGGISAHPALAYHNVGNPTTQQYTGTVTIALNASGQAVFTIVTGSTSPEMSSLSYAGTNYRVTCQTTSTPNTCTADIGGTPTSTPGAFIGYSAMSHYGMLFQDGPNGNVVQDTDFFMVDSAYTMIRAAGRHAIVLDTSQDAAPYAINMAGGQNQCFSSGAACESYSPALSSLLLSPSSAPANFTIAMNPSNGNITTKGLFVGSPAPQGTRATFGYGSSQGFYYDDANIALRAPTAGGNVYIQGPGNSGVANLGVTGNISSAGYILGDATTAGTRAYFGTGITVGFYYDDSNIALRAPVSGGNIYVQGPNNTGIANMAVTGTLAAAGLIVNSVSTSPPSGTAGGRACFDNKGTLYQGNC